MNLKRNRLKRYKLLKKYKLIFKTMPTVLLCLLLTFMVVILTGMCAIFPKKSIVVYDGDENIGTIHTNSKNLKEAIDNYLYSKRKKKLEDNDTYSVSEVDKNTSEARIIRSFTLDVKVFDEKKKVTVNFGDSVLDVLNALGLSETEGLDVSPSLETKVTKETNIIVSKKPEQEQQLNEEDKVNNTKEKDSNKNKEYCSKKTHKKSSDKIKHNESVEKKNKNKEEKHVKGKEAKNKHVKTNGKEVKNKTYKKNKQNEKNKQNKKNKNVNRKHKGKTNFVVNQGAGSHPAAGEYSKVYSGVTTAYLAKGKTARMGPARRGVVAADPRVFPYGTKLYIEGYGHCVVGDKCGAACKGGVLVDVCLNSKAECSRWGRRKTNIYALTK